MTPNTTYFQKISNLESIVDGEVKVRALPDEALGEETLKLLADTYQSLFNAHLGQN